jgi:hypothetical protein
MSDDLLRLVVIAAVALVAYQVLQGNGLIKNTGALSTEPYMGEEEEAEAEAEAETGEEGPVPSEQGPPKRVVNSQIQDEIYKNNPNVLAHPQISNNFAPQGNFEPNSAHNFAQLDCFPKDQTQPKDLLPPDGGFAESNPAGQGQLMNRNLFESSHHAGLNTQSSTLKNANRQLRSDPLIPRRDVGPWNQSTYEADTNRRAFEIGTA